MLSTVQYIRKLVMIGKINNKGTEKVEKYIKTEKQLSLI